MTWHTPRSVGDGYGTSLYVSSQVADRLVVFVHGFNGEPIGTWRDFDQSATASEWWATSDLLFFGYDSLTEAINNVVDRFRRTMRNMYPKPPSRLFAVGAERLRNTDPHYRELVLVGHSMGGLIVRRAVADAASSWIAECRHSGSATLDVALRPSLLDARTFLFSPASAGFRPAGWLGVAKATGILRLAEVRLRKAPAYVELKRHSPIIKQTQKLTKSLIKLHGSVFMNSLEATILWASPDKVVHVERYRTDFRWGSMDGQSHTTVCKPNRNYIFPWLFVETGEVYDD